jgi:hypothetical protein
MGRTRKFTSGSDSVPPSQPSKNGTGEIFGASFLGRCVLLPDSRALYATLTFIVDYARQPRVPVRKGILLARLTVGQVFGVLSFPCFPTSRPTLTIFHQHSLQPHHGYPASGGNPLWLLRASLPWRILRGHVPMYGLVANYFRKS